MHELGITRNIVGIVNEHAAGRRVTRVRLSIGQLSAISDQAIAFCFDLCSQGTLVEGAKLEVFTIPGRLKCRLCGAETLSATLYGQCACGSFEMQCIGGEELLISEIELE